MQVNKSFSARGSAVVDVPFHGCYVVSGMTDGRRVLTMRTERPGQDPTSYKLSHLSLAINMRADEAARLGRLILGDDDPLIKLARRVADLNKDAGEIGAGMLAQLVDDARLALGRELKP